MDVIGLFKHAYAMIRKNPKILVPQFILAIVAYIVTGVSTKYPTNYTYNITSALNATAPATAATPAISWIGIVVLIFVLLPLGILLSGFYISYANANDNDNPKLDYNAALNKSKSRFLDLLGTSILLVAIGVALLIIIFLIALASTAVALILGILALLAYAIIVGIYCYLVNSVVVLEGRKYMDAIRRAIDLARPLAWSIVKIYLITIVLVIVYVVIDFLFVYINATLATLVQSLLEAFLAVILVFVTVLFYKEASSGKSTSSQQPAKQSKPTIPKPSRKRKR